MGVTPRNSFSRETRTQDKVDGQLQQRRKKSLCYSALCQQGRHSHHQFEELHIMRAFLIFALAASATAQLKFGSDPTEAPKKDVNTRLGLLSNSLCLSPTAEQTSSGLSQGSSSGGQSSAFTQGSSSGQTPTGRVPSGGEFTGSFSQCCCVPLNEQCGDPLGRDIDYDYDLVGSGLIDPRLKPLRGEAAKKTQKAKDGLGLRIVNRPNANTNSQINTCPIGQKACCYDPSVDHSSFGRSCIAPGSSAQQFESVRYGCNNKLKNALNAQRAGSGNRFSLSQSEICAGGQVGKDACTGDGGSPLVCQGQSGRWTVVGLVTWGVGCASDVPGVYARMSHFAQWINEN